MIKLRNDRTKRGNVGGAIGRRTGCRSRRGTVIPQLVTRGAREYASEVRARKCQTARDGGRRGVENVTGRSLLGGV